MMFFMFRDNEWVEVFFWYFGFVFCVLRILIWFFGMFFYYLFNFFDFVSIMFYIYYVKLFLDNYI